jgi:2-dehydropantoate 2-reductase
MKAVDPPGRPERITLVGAGAVGMLLGARLAARGHRVIFAVRRPELAERIRREGVAVVDAVSGLETRARAEAAVGAEALRGADDGPVVVAVRAADTAALAVQLVPCAPNALWVSAQNDVDNEALLARHARRVAGMVVRQTATRIDDTHVRTLGSGRLVLGSHPSGLGEGVRELAASLADAGFDVGLSPRISEDKWLKLCVNLMSSVNALVRQADHERPAFVKLKTALLEEARAVLKAAGITAGSSDGRDRSLDEEILHQSSALELGHSARKLPLYNACWAALDDPRRPLEADAYHARILELGGRQRIDTPTHAVMLEAVRDAWQRATGPERLRADELLTRVRIRVGSPGE